MRMLHWTERVEFSLQHDATMARISGFDENRQEHWLMIPAHVKGYREARQEAVIKIMEAIEDDGHLPGEVE